MKKILFAVALLLALFLFGCEEIVVEQEAGNDDAQASIGSENKNIEIVLNDDGSDDEVNPLIVGGDRDEHGCIGSAGYSWCEVKQKCLRIWEESCELLLDKNKVQAQSIAMNYARSMVEYKRDNGRNIRLIDVENFSCEGCWNIGLEYDVNSVKGGQVDKITLNMTLNSFKPSSIVSSRRTLAVLVPGKCESIGGRSVDHGSGQNCASGEINIGDVLGSVSKHICCKTG